MTTKITEKNISSIANTAVQRQSVHVADGSTALTTSAGKGYFIDTTSAAQTVNLPSVDDSTLGDTIVLKDFARQWGTNNVTLAANTFEASSGDTRTFSTTGQSVTLVFTTIANGWQLVNDDTVTTLGPAYVEATGGTVTTSGDFKTHVFTADGCFVVSCAGNSAGNNTVDYFVVAGGAGGGGRSGAGGGAGGFRYSNSFSLPGPLNSPLANPTGLTVSSTTFPVSVGAGGAGGPNTGSPIVGSSGSNSVFSTITSAGGGGGATAGNNGVNGGSGGGGGGEVTGSPSTGGTGNTPPVSPPQGNNGGTGTQGPTNRAAGGGGGAGAVGTAGSGSTGGAGAVGSFVDNNFFGPTSGCSGTTGPVSNTRYFAAGGGGGVESAPPLGPLGSNGAGGSGGGGQGGPGPTARGAGGNATANTGSGGGGASRYNCAGPPYSAAGNGGKGIVVIRYKFQN